MNKKIGWAAGILAVAATVALGMALPAGAVADTSDGDRGWMGMENGAAMDTHMGTNEGPMAAGSHMGGGTMGGMGAGHLDSATMDEHMNTIGAGMMASGEDHDWGSMAGQMGSWTELCLTAMDAAEPPAGP